MKKLLLILIALPMIGFGQNQIIWDAISDVSLSSFGNNHPRIVHDGGGNPLVIWNNSNNVMFSKWNGLTFSTPIELNPTNIDVAGASFMGPDIASHGDTIYVVYKENPENLITTPIWCTASYDNGVTFQTAVKIENSPTSMTRFPTITTDDSGNPIVAFMKLDSSFTNARWFVSVSNDFGTSFQSPVLASGWSSPTSEVCDCCPGSIVSSGDNILMLYRDNNSNIRDTWVGISSDLGNSFSNGVNLSNQNWFLNSCPGSGPDAVIIGDTLYSTFMNGSSGLNRVYFSKLSLITLTTTSANLLTGNISGLSQQNYPRIAKSGNSLAFVWNQNINGNYQLPIISSENINNGIPLNYDTVSLNNIKNTDIVMFDNQICVVWEDDNSGTVKYRFGTFSIPSTVSESTFIGNKKLLKVTDLLGRETTDIKNEVLFYIYDDGTVEKRIIIE
jgi:hypothetical protein